MELEPGDNYLWACVTMKEGASLDGRVVVRPASVVAGNKPVRVANATPVAQRIGVAVVRHGDFKSKFLPYSRSGPFQEGNPAGRVRYPVQPFRRPSGQH